MNITQILKEDYQRFPVDQTYSIYAKDVFFKDPLNQFRGVERYKQMIGFMHRWFSDPKMDLHEIQRREDIITTRWTLSWTTPLPWRPRIAIPGWSELRLNADELIIAHLDYWECDRLDVLRQHFFLKKG